MPRDKQLYNDALMLFESKQYEQAFPLFEELSLKYEAGYCLFAQGMFREAQEMWESSKIDSPAIVWGLAIINLINLTIPRRLTFFQIRNFLERDLKVLIESKQLKAVENIISAAEILVECNPETYKFVGRVLLNTGYSELAIDFLKKAKDICFMDAEIHHLIAEYYVTIGDISAAIKVLNKSLVFNPNYFPAKDMLARLTKN